MYTLLYRAPAAASSGRVQKCPAAKDHRAFLELVMWLEHTTCWLRISCSTDWATLAYQFMTWCFWKGTSRTGYILSYFLTDVNRFFWFPATLSAWQFLYITFCILKEFLQNIFRRLAYFLRFSPEFRPLQQEILLWFSQETSTNSVIIFCWLPSFCSLPFFSAFT